MSGWPGQPAQTSLGVLSIKVPYAKYAQERIGEATQTRQGNIDISAKWRRWCGDSRPGAEGSRPQWGSRPPSLDVQGWLCSPRVL